MLTSWFLFVILLCGFCLYDLIDPALKNSLEQLEDGDNDNEGQINERKRSSLASQIKIHPISYDEEHNMG